MQTSSELDKSISSYITQYITCGITLPTKASLNIGLKDLAECVSSFLVSKGGDLVPYTYKHTKLTNDIVHSLVIKPKLVSSLEYLLTSKTSKVKQLSVVDYDRFLYISEKIKTYIKIKDKTSDLFTFWLEEKAKGQCSDTAKELLKSFSTYKFEFPDLGAAEKVISGVSLPYTLNPILVNISQCRPASPHNLFDGFILELNSTSIGGVSVMTELKGLNNKVLGAGLDEHLSALETAYPAIRRHLYVIENIIRIGLEKYVKQDADGLLALIHS